MGKTDSRDDTLERHLQVVFSRAQENMLTDSYFHNEKCYYIPHENNFFLANKNSLELPEARAVSGNFKNSDGLKGLWKEQYNSQSL